MIFSAILSAGFGVAICVQLGDEWSICKLSMTELGAAGHLFG